ncbi:MAG: multidrug efflux SMR transporter [Sulfurimonas sp.]
MHWLYLFGAILFEVMGTLSIKQTTLTNSYYWGTAVAVFYIISFTLIGFAVKKIDMGTAYAIWAGFGTASITILGWLLFKECMTIQKVIAVVLIIIGSVMLKMQHT